MHGAALAAVAVAAFGLVGLKAVDLPGPRPISDGDRLRIEVVQPIEPKVSPGSIMDVGELENGFTHLPPPPPAEPMPAAYAYDAWLDETLPPPPVRRRPRDETIDYPPPAEEARAQGGDRWFGFDAPRRDYPAEREARRARLDAMERHERRERDAAWRREGDDERRGRREPPADRAPSPWWG